MELITFTCPRCQIETVADYYSPCQTCRDQLRKTMGSAGHDLAAPEYQPKLNVTPNAVATKDD